MRRLTFYAALSLTVVLIVLIGVWIDKAFSRPFFIAPALSVEAQ